MEMLHDPDVRPFGDSLGLIQTTDPLLGTSVLALAEAACQSVSQSDVISGKPVGQINLYRFLAFWTLEFDYSRRRRDLVQHTPATVRAFLRNPHVFPLFSQYHHLPSQYPRFRSGAADALHRGGRAASSGCSKPAWTPRADSTCCRTAHIPPDATRR